MNLPEILSKQFGVDLTPQMGDVISRVFRKEEVRKKTTLFMNGDSNTRHYFVIKGLLRLYIIDSSGKEFNLLFAYENQVIGDLASPAPLLLQRLPQYHVASYLGVSPEFLRKIIARIVKK